VSDSGVRLHRTVDAFRGRTVAVLGDLVVDEFVHGDIARVSREAPVLILEHRQTLVVPGGGGNAVANLAGLGARPLPVGVVGDDAAGKGLLRAFRERGISTRGIVVVRGLATPTKSRVLAGGVHTRRQQIVRIDRGLAHGSLPAEVRATLRARLQDAVGRSAGLLIADYGYGAAEPAIGHAVALEAVRTGLPATVDSRGRVAAYRGLTASTPNQEELETALGLAPLPTDDDVARAGRALLRKTAHDAIVVTRGSRGMTLFRPRRAPVHVPAFGSDEVADVTGAGDTVIATFTLALIAGADPLDAARLANYAAGIVVMKAGTATVSPAEVHAAIDGTPS